MNIKNYIELREIINNMRGLYYRVGRATGLALLSIMILISSFNLVPAPLPTGIVLYQPGELTSFTQSSSNYSRDEWLNLAGIAWRYYKNTVDCSGTGLPRAGFGWPYFTQWDLAQYLFATMSAAKLGIIPVDGVCGAKDRIRKVVDWLKSAELSPNNQMYLWYRQSDGKPAKEISDAETNISDYGYFLIALARVKDFYPEVAGDIDYAILTRIDTESMANSENAWRQAGGLFKYFVAHGFKLFGFGNSTQVSNALKILKQAYDTRRVTTYGVELPVLSITTEPLVLGVFTLDNDPLLLDLALRVYIAQQRRYENTGKFTAFTEGNTGLDYPNYVYEWIVTGDGRTWVVYPPTTPIIFFKAAIGLHAIFPRSYTRAMLDYVLSKFTDLTNGFQLGVDENGRLVDYWVDSTNAITLMAAEYAIRRMDTPSLQNYPAFCSLSSGELSAAMVIGDTNPHGLYMWRAYTIDVIGGIRVGYRLGREFNTGDLIPYLDTQVTSSDNEAWKVDFAWQHLKNFKCIISIGGPAVNMLSYNLERSLGVPFFLTWINGRPYIESNLTGSLYTYADDFSWDYGIISISTHNGVYFISAWGLTHQGTQAASMLLRYKGEKVNGVLDGLAIIFKWEDYNQNGIVDLNDTITLVERWNPA
jgi:hypothetical protein